MRRFLPLISQALNLSAAVLSHRSACQEHDEECSDVALTDTRTIDYLSAGDTVTDSDEEAQLPKWCKVYLVFCDWAAIVLPPLSHSFTFGIVRSIAGLINRVTDVFDTIRM